MKLALNLVVTVFLLVVAGQLAQAYTYGTYSNGGSYVLPAVNSSPLPQGGTYLIDGYGVVAADVPTAALAGTGLDGYGGGYGGYYAEPVYAGGAAGYGGVAAYGGIAPYGYPYPVDNTYDVIGNAQVAENFIGSGSNVQLAQQEFYGRAFSNPECRGLDLVNHNDGGQGFTVQAGETEYFTIGLKNYNEFGQPFYVEYAEVIEESDAFEGRVVATRFAVDPWSQSTLRLALSGGNVSVDAVDGMQIVVVGHYPDGVRCQAGPLNALVYVNRDEVEPARVAPAYSGKVELKPYPPAKAAAIKERVEAEFQAVSPQPSGRVEVVNYSSAVRVIDSAEVPVTLFNDSDVSQDVDVAVAGSELRVRNQRVSLNAGETKTVRLEAMNRSLGKGEHSASLVVATAGQRMELPLRFVVEGKPQGLQEEGLIEGVNGAAVAALATLATGTVYVGAIALIVLVLFLAARALFDGQRAEKPMLASPHVPNAAWRNHKPAN